MSKAKIISFSKDKKSAEVVFLEDNKSFTRHLKLKLVKCKDKNNNECEKYQWFYLSPYKKEEPLVHDDLSVPDPPSKNADKKDNDKSSDDDNSKDAKNQI